MGQREGIDLKRLFHGNILTNLIYFLGFLTNLFIFLVFLDFLYFLPPSFFPREKLEALKENGFDIDQLILGGDPFNPEGDS